MCSPRTRRPGCTRVNPVAERLTGWSETEAIGRPIGEVFHIINEETRAPAIIPIARVLAEGVVVGLANHTALVSRDGSECPIADSGAPILTHDGKATGAVLVFRDVSEERRAERGPQTERGDGCRLMISSVRDYALYMLDPVGRVASWNPGAELIKGYRADEIVGQHFSRFFTPEDVASGKPGPRVGDREDARTIRRGGLESPQGRDAFLGERRHHADSRRVERLGRLRENHA